MKRAASPPSSSVQKRVRLHTPPRASLSTWLKPGEPAPLLLSSPHLHAVSSTFTSFAMSLSPPSNVRTPEALKKYAASIVRGLDVVSLVGKELIESKDGCFQNDGGLAPGPRPKAREPDHKMWACRALVLKEGKDGTQGEEDYQLLEAQEDDGERFGGDRVLKVLKEIGAVDVLVVCARWFGGDMLGPARFSHIGVTAQHAAQALMERVKLRDLRTALTTLDEAIGELRRELAILSAVEPSEPASVGATDSSPTKKTATAQGGDATDTATEKSATDTTTSNGATSTSATDKPAGTATPNNSQSATAAAPEKQARTPVPAKPNYAAITDPVRLERLLAAKEKTMANLESKLAVLRAEREA